MFRHKLHRTTALALTGLAFAAAHADDRDRASARKATPTTATVAALASGGLGPAGEGRRLYLRLNCYGCHGMSATGGMGPNIARAEFGDVSEAVLNGEDEGMRSYRNYVTATDIANLAAYLASIGTASEPKFRDWWVPVPAK